VLCHNIFAEFSIEINTGKEKQHYGFTRSRKMYINTWIQEQIDTFNYLGCIISCKGEKEFNVRIVNLNTRIRSSNHD
jgi:hypothetical protein